MPEVRQLTSVNSKFPGVVAGTWVTVIRAGGQNCRVQPLDGVSHDALVPMAHLGNSFKVAPSAITTSGINTRVFRQYPVKLHGIITTQSPAGKYEVTGLTSAETPLGLNSPPSVPSSPQTPVRRTVPSNTSRNAVNAGISDDALTNLDGTPIISVDKMGVMLDALPTKRSVMIWGPAGVGKSQGVAKWCLGHNLKLFDVRLPLLDPIDLRGIGVPDLENNTCRWLPPEFIPREPGCVLFLDEISSATPAVQAAAYQLTLDRKIGETSLPPDCRVIAAGNRTGDKGVSYRMPAPLANRFVHFTIIAAVADWKNWAFKNDIDPKIISFLVLNPQKLHMMEEANSGSAWPSPRSWEFVSEILKSNLQGPHMGLAVAGCVGVAAARDFIKHVEDYMVYSRKVEEILRGLPEAIKKENDASKTQIMATALVCHCRNDEIQLNNVIRWGLCQNRELTALAVKGLEQKFGIDTIFGIASYQEYLNPRMTPNPSGSNRTDDLRPPF